MAWYNTYRPQNFNDVIGQTLVKTVLQNALEFNIIKHAYLFSGPKGTGKTTLARIFAASLNQTDLFPEAKLDIIELDAASNTGVDDVRQLIENSNVPPISGRYKVYIIDEVHMLSKQAMNALLKTLEEPPAYLVFLLATTNPEKLLPTVLSRLTKLNLTSHSISNIADRLRFIANEQKILIDDASLILIAKRSNGGQRDAINLLETLHSYNLLEYTLPVTSDLLGLLPEELLEQVGVQLLSKTLSPNSLEKITSFNLDGETFLGQLLDWVLEKSLNNNPSFDKLIIPLAEVASMRLPITNPLHSLAIVQVKLANEAPIIIETANKNQNIQTQKPLPTIPPTVILAPKISNQIQEEKQEDSKKDGKKELELVLKPKDFALDTQAINQYLTSLKANNDCPMTLKIMLSDLGVESVNEDNSNEIVLSISNGVFMTQIKSAKNIDYLKQKLLDYTDKIFEIQIIQRAKKEISKHQETPIEKENPEIQNQLQDQEYINQTENQYQVDEKVLEPKKQENKIFYEAYNKLAPNMQTSGVTVFVPPIKPPLESGELAQEINHSNSVNLKDDWQSSISDFDLED